MYDNVTDQTWTDKTYNASDYIFEKGTSVFTDREVNSQQPMSNVVPARPDNDLGTGNYIATGYVDDGYVAS